MLHFSELLFPYLGNKRLGLSLQEIVKILLFTKKKTKSFIQSCFCYYCVYICLECHLHMTTCPFAQGWFTSGMASSSRKPPLTTVLAVLEPLLWVPITLGFPL